MVKIARVVFDQGINTKAYFHLRNNCAKLQWAIGDESDPRNFIGNEMPFVLIAYECVLGLMPPIKNVASLNKILAQRNQPPIQEGDEARFLKEVSKLAQPMAYIWFLPVIEGTPTLEKAVADGKIPADAIYATIIKSRSLDGTKTTGLWKLISDLLIKKINPSEVIITPEFRPTHTVGATGKPVSGLHFEWHHPATEAEKRAVTQVNELIDKLDEDFFTLPEVMSASVKVPESQLRGMTADDAATLIQATLYGVQSNQYLLEGDAEADTDYSDDYYDDDSSSSIELDSDISLPTGGTRHR